MKFAWRNKNNNNIYTGTNNEEQQLLKIYSNHFFFFLVIHDHKKIWNENSMKRTVKVTHDLKNQYVECLDHNWSILVLRPESLLYQLLYAY